MAVDIKNDATLSTGLKSYWELEEASGTRVDSHGTNDLTDNNTVTSVTGIQGDAADFLGTNSESLSGTRIGHIEGVPMSYNFWVNLPSTSQKGVFLSDSGNGGINNGFAIGVGSGTLDTNGNRLIIPFWGVSWQDTVVSIGTGWHMITLIIQADQKALAYLDSTLIFTGTSVMGVFANSPFYIGRDGYGVAPRYLSDGSIDEVGVWDKVLTAGEITDLYNSGAGLPYEAAGAPAANSGWFNFL
jgi:hypothetical protein